MYRPANGIARLAVIALPAALLLAACSEEASDEVSFDEDGSATSALGEAILVDPDLAAQNQANSALAAGGPDAALPPELRTPEALARARAEALKMVGGPGSLKKAPTATEMAGELPADAAYSLARAAANLPGTGDCAAKAEYTMQWAAKLPEAFPVYPQGSVLEAAGTDAGPCSLRVVNFVTGLPLGEVIDFYYTRATNAGFSTQYLDDGETKILAGVKGDASYVIYARSLATGGTEVDISTGG